MGTLQSEIKEDVGSVPNCKACGSERIVRLAHTCWNGETGLWELEKELEQYWCQNCEIETKIYWARNTGTARKRIREMNDVFRTQGIGNGSILITAGIQALGKEFTQKAMFAVKEFTDFTEDNDPWGEHDFGSLDLSDQKVFWKIDYYDPSLTMGSENAANEAVTHRVLTIMLASEY